MTDRTTGQDPAIRDLLGDDRIWRLVLEQSGDGIIFADAATRRFVEANERACAMLGYARHELLGLSVADIHPPADLERVGRAFEDLRAGRIQVAEALPCLRKDGTVFHADITSKRLAVGERELMVGMLRDVTDRQRAADLRREVAAAESRQLHHLRLMLDSLFAFVAVLDLGGTVLECNRAPLDAAGIPAGEVLGRKFWDCWWWSYDAGVQARLRAAFARALRGESPRYDERIRVAGGRFMVIDVMFAPFRNERGEIVYVIPSAVDVDERARATAELERVRGSLEATLDAMPDLLFEVDAEGRYHAFRASRTDRLYVRPEAFLGRTVREVLPADAAEVIMAAIAEACASGRHQGGTYALDLPGGRSWFELSIARKAPDPQLGVRLVVLCRDVTERKRAGDLLREQEEKYRRLFEEAADGIVLADADTGVILDCNQALADLVGRPRAGIVGLHQSALHPPADAPDGFTAGFAAQRRQGGGATNEERLLAADGRVLDVQIRGSLVRLGGRRVLQGIFRDVSAQRRTARAEREALARAEEAARAKDRFLATVSHEIRTPLHGVLGLAEILGHGELAPEQRGHLAQLQASGRLLLDVVNDILDYSRLQAGKMPLDTRPFAVAGLLEDVRGLLAPAAAAKGLDFSARAEPGVPPAVCGDRFRLQQVLLNLAGNAVKFTERGSVALSVSAHDAGGGRPGLRFLVADTGVGFPPALAARLFQPFEQADGSDARRHGGSGLGLAICKELVGLMGGTIGAEGRPGEGARFWFTLPLAAAPDGTGAPAARPAPAAPGAPARRLRVLVAEDDFVARTIIAKVLARLGHDATVVTDGREALAAWRTATFDLVIMDCQMPGLDGFETTRRLRTGEAGPAAAAVPVVALTAGALEGDRRACLDAGMDDHLTKPVVVADLAAALRRWAGGRG